MKDIRYITSLTLLCFLLGAIISMQVKAINKQPKTTVGVQRANELSASLFEVTSENETLKQKLIDAEDKISNYEHIVTNAGESTHFIQEQLEEARALAGLTELYGRGIVITLSDSKKVMDKNIEKSVLLIHDEDILLIINELNAAGCEAISINEQRIISNGSVRCVGPVISVNGRKIAAPYTINAIGDPDVLESALNLPGGVIDGLLPWGIEVGIKKMQEVTIPKFDGVVEFVEAKKK